MRLRALWGLMLLLGCTVLPRALSQDAPSIKSPTSRLEPESGMLSQTRYTSLYFGFALNLPPSSDLRRIRATLQPSGIHALLALRNFAGDRSTRLVIRAHDARESGVDAEFFARERLQQLRESEPTWHGPEAKKFGDLPAWRIEIGQGGYAFVHSLSWFFALRGYVVQVDLDYSDEEYGAKMVKHIESMEFFSAPLEDGRAAEVVGPGAEPYNGPALPTSFVDRMLTERPGEKLDAGEWHGQEYRNASAGLRVRLPQGWVAKPTTSAEHILLNGVDPDVQLETPDRRHELWLACTRTLIVAEDRAHAAVPGLYPALVITLLKRDCMPDLDIPTQKDDAFGLDLLASTLVRATEMTKFHRGRWSQRGQNVTFALDGSLPYEVPQDRLARRLSLQLLLVPRGEYFITVFAMAENADALRRLEQGIVLEGADAKASSAH
ncbi:MAG TPA: hypothetical protein VMU24_03460 [Candidatus Acidoferrales bacterium]|nr:hypothetical protein [Candidatus Acidoferrales bacterium]